MNRRAQVSLGCLVEIAINDELTPTQLQAAFSKAFAAIHNVNALMSFHHPDSDVGRFNRAASGSALKLDPHTVSVLACAQQVHQHSAGLFNVAAASRLAQWGLLPNENDCVIPSFQSQHLLYRILAEDTVEKLSHGWIDLGGIAKGYAVDQAISALERLEIHSACVNAGGDLRVIGDSIEVWLRDPLQPNNMKQKIKLTNAALASSGTYFSRKVVETTEVSALVDGINGRAIVNCAGYSIIAKQCVYADALTKVLAASGNLNHPCFSYFDAEAFII